MRYLKIQLIFAVIIIMLFPVTAHAETELNVNGTKVSHGDVVTYEYYLSGVKDPIEAVGAYLIYDPQSLEYIEGSVGFDVLENAMINFEEGNIYYSAINIYDGYDCTDEQLLVRASFKVCESAKGSLLINNQFDEIFTFVNEEEDLSPSDYTSRQNILINDSGGNVSLQTPTDAKKADFSAIGEQSDTQSSKNENGKTIAVAAASAVIVIGVSIAAAAALKKKK
ncbi:MAG: hypothetical protein II685_04185 [Clostridia bacterium]|nr:hypothetical protein [Clostridia bacterium]